MTTHLESVQVTVDRALVARVEALEAEVTSANANREHAEQAFRRIANENVSLERYVDVVREALMRLKPLARNEGLDVVMEAVAAIVKMHPEHWGPRRG